jgi:hypothetical protein
MMMPKTLCAYDSSYSAAIGKRLYAYLILATILTFLSACGRQESKAPPKTGDTTAASAPSSSAQLAPAGPALSDFKCELIAKGIPKSMEAGSEETTIQLEVTNKSSAKWFAFLPSRSIFNSVNIGYRWYNGKNLIMDGTSRGKFSADVESGATAQVELKIAAPKEPGVYTLRISPVQEAIAWFCDSGGCKFEASIKVVPRK